MRRIKETLSMIVLGAAISMSGCKFLGKDRWDRKNYHELEQYPGRREMVYTEPDHFRDFKYKESKELKDLQKRQKELRYSELMYTVRGD